MALSVKDAARLLDASRNSVCRAVRTDQILGVTLGEGVAVPRAVPERRLSEADKPSSDDT